MPEEVLVFQRAFFPDLFRGGLCFDTGLLAEVLAASRFMPRDAVENDPTFKQLIPYSLLRYRGKVFRYMRTTRAGERRLHGLYSIGVGGHINRQDSPTPALGDGSIADWARDREVSEEFAFECSYPPQLVALLNDDSTDVGRVHFGIIYEYQLDSPHVGSKERGLHIHHSFVSIPELVAHGTEYEGWSQIVIAQYLAKELGHE